jgi:hypothetical protein
MERQVCQFQTVSTKGFTPFQCANCVPDLDPLEAADRLTADQSLEGSLLCVLTCLPAFAITCPRLWVLGVS